MLRCHSNDFGCELSDGIPVPNNGPVSGSRRTPPHSPRVASRSTAASRHSAFFATLNTRDSARNATTSPPGARLHTQVPPSVAMSLGHARTRPALVCARERQRAGTSACFGSTTARADFKDRAEAADSEGVIPSPVTPRHLISPAGHAGAAGMYMGVYV
ncbi:hypothetical protein C8Q79DRAFT_304997 [Trametes meyenii]|nr:hypothetical protein C8Q79DRAFT_304997 [Trametes meyenii]